MSGVAVTFEYAELANALASLKARLDDPKPALYAIGQVLVTATDLNFKGQHDPWGTPWKPLAPSTLRRRRKKGARARILRDTGVLANSINAFLSGDSVSVGTNIEYAAVHQFGAEIHRKARVHTMHFKRGKDGSVGNRFVRKAKSNFSQDVHVGPYTIKIPARPFFPIRNGAVDFPEKVKQQFMKTLSAHLDNAL